MAAEYRTTSALGSHPASPRRRWATSLAAAAIVALGCALLRSAPALAVSRVALVPASGPAGTQVTLLGGGFRRDQPVVIRAGGQALARVTSSGAGRFSAQVTVPAATGRRVDLVSGRGATRVISHFLVSAAADATRTTEVSSSRGARVRGRPLNARTVWIRASGLPARARMRLGYRGVPAAVTAVRLAALRANRHGGFSRRLALPLPPPRQLALRLRARHTNLALPLALRVPVIGAAGDIACPTSSRDFNGGNGTPTACQMRATSDLLMGAEVGAVLPLGDTQYELGKLTQFRASYDLSWGRLRAISRPVPGDHEYLTPGAAGYFAYFNGVGASTGPAGRSSEGYYSYDVGTWHLVALNSACMQIGGCEPGSPEERWLRSDLAAHPAACTLAYWHEPRFSSGQNGSSVAIDAFWRDLAAAGADVVLSADDHDYERFAPQDANGQAADRGIREFVVGAGGRNLRRFKPAAVPNSEVRLLAFGVLLLTLRPGGYDWRYVEAGTSRVLDAGSGTCN